jgi:hypothetical protein
VRHLRATTLAIHVGSFAHLALASSEHQTFARRRIIVDLPAQVLLAIFDQVGELLLCEVRT